MLRSVIVVAVKRRENERACKRSMAARGRCCYDRLWLREGGGRTESAQSVALRRRPCTRFFRWVEMEAASKL